MFGALNRFISRLDSDAQHSTSRDRYNAFGFQVLRNKNSEILIEPWYDFIIGINGRHIENPDPALFTTETRNCAGSSVALTMYSAKGQRTLTIDIPVPTPSPTLGLTLQWSPLAIADQVWHILSVTPSSPADTAGLLPYSDYIVGTPEGHVHGEAGLGELVEEYISRQLRLWVFNHEYNVTRLVTITPSRSWGGEGALGCVLGFGALHKLPAPLSEGPVEGPGEALFEGVKLSGEQDRAPSASAVSSLKENMGFETTTNQFSGNLLVPASLTSPPPLQPPTSVPTGGPPKGARRGKKAISPSVAFDEYFKEEEQKSKEEDFAPDSKAAPPPPPPGKSGIPQASGAGEGKTSTEGTNTEEAAV
ncbi:MAG: hypothetical protein Q9217_002328 [Psora testacea]